MRYAIISDIHGNLPALQAVLEDIKQHNIDELIFVGDYYCDLPYPNEVTDTIRNLDKAHIVRGNKEDYLVNLVKTDQSEWTYDQFAPLYWNYYELTEDNRNYLMTLPHDMSLSTPDNRHNLYISHANMGHDKIINLKHLSSSSYRYRMEDEPFDRDGYCTYAHNLLADDDGYIEALNNADHNIIIFGHSHIQWHTTIAGKLLINPGSCGCPLDYDTGAAYTILIIEGENLKVQEKRVPYDIHGVINETRDSPLYQASPIWGAIMHKELQTGADEIIHFFTHVSSIANKKGDTNFPYSNEIWQEASNTWI